jgi:hypothetical protein
MDLPPGSGLPHPPITTVVEHTPQAVNFTGITDVVNATVSLMPSIVDLVVAIVPVIITMAIVSLITGIFGAIVALIRGGF